jgi:glycosyltransferase involved in cell wall biosynthesis
MLQNGKHGWFFEKKPESVSQVVEQAEGEPQKMEELRQTARLGLTLKYNWDAVTDQYLEVFEKLAVK